ncbi:MAG: GNAT family N-acetyltransferase [Anaerolineae bacterium]|nr:GNAT family N-acetyltransferase [Anaerolineae bacterium]
MKPVLHVGALDGLAALLADAFRDDPGMAYLCQSGRAGYNQRLRAWFGAMLRLQAANHQPIVTLSLGEELVGCAVMTAPNARLRFFSLIRWMVTVGWGLGLRGLWRTLAHIQRLAAYQPYAPHFRLEFIAVALRYQGKGYSRALLDDLHQRALAHPDSVGVWLETANATNVPLYQRFDYIVSAQTTIGGEVGAVIMFRPNPS